MEEKEEECFEMFYVNAHIPNLAAPEIFSEKFSDGTLGLVSAIQPHAEHKARQQSVS